MSRATGLALVGVSLFLLVLPLTVGKPGLPAGLKADESAYYSMALSLARDFDLRFELRDADRLFEEFHFRPTRNLIVLSDDGFNTAYYGKPYVYSLAAAPFARLFGANGMVFLNMLLTVAMVWLGTSWLSRHNEPAIAAMFSAGFFLLSAGFSYVFWLQPEVFNMFCATVALYLGLRPESTAAADWRRWLAMAGSGAAIALAVYNKPMAAALALPVVAPLLWPRFAPKRAGRHLASFGVGFSACLLATCGLCWALTGHPLSYLGQGIERRGVDICEPGIDPLAPLAAERATQARVTAGGAGDTKKSDEAIAETRNWSWLLRIPPLRPREAAQNIGYFLWGRHTGLLLYFPFTGICIALFLLHARSSVTRWLLLAALSSVALFLLLFISWNWQGGGGFIGNRYFVNVVPGFLFLVTTIRPPPVVAAGYGLAGLLLGPLLLSPFGLNVPAPTLQAHARNFPLRLFPYELTLRNLPGYHILSLPESRLIVREDLAVPRGGGFWVAGSTRTEALLLTLEPLGRTTLSVRGLAERTSIRIALGDASADLELGPGETRRVELTPIRPAKLRYRLEQTWRVYPFEVTTDRGAVVHWTLYRAPGACVYFDHNESFEEPFYAGAEVTILGPSDYLEQNVYAVEWDDPDVPAKLEAGREVEITTRVTNRSPSSWTARGAARVALSYHWLAPDGSVLTKDGVRTQLARPVESGEELVQRQKIAVPSRPGRYTLELDLVFEHVSWFAERNGGNTKKIAVEVVEADRTVSPGTAKR